MIVFILIMLVLAINIMHLFICLFRTGIFIYFLSTKIFLEIAKNWGDEENVEGGETEVTLFLFDMPIYAVFDGGKFS